MPDLTISINELRELAGMSVSGFALRELTEIARRADNPALLDALPDLAVSAEAVLAELDAGRADR